MLIDFLRRVPTMRAVPLWIMKCAMMLLPLACIVIGFIIYAKKFRIDEKMYARIISDFEQRKEQSQ